MQIRNKQAIVVLDKVLECQSHQGVITLQLAQGRKSERTVVDDPLVRLDALEVEPCVVVAQAEASLAKFTSRFRIDPPRLGEEPRLGQVLDDRRDVPAPLYLQRLGDLRSRLRSVHERLQHACGKPRLLRNHIAEHVVEVLPQEASRHEAQPPDVVYGGKRRVYLLQVSRNAARHRKDVYDLAGIRPRRLAPPELDALARRQFAHHHVERTPSDVCAALDNSVANPARHASAKHQHEIPMFLEKVVPCVLQYLRECQRIVRHPRNLVEEDDRAPAPAKLAVKPHECGIPVGRRGLFAARLRGELCGEERQLVALGHPGLRAKPLQLDEPCV